MPITRNKKLAMYALLSTRSHYRGQLEGTQAKNPPQSEAEMLERFRTVPLPPGIDQVDMEEMIEGRLSDLFDPECPTAKGNISTDPEDIAFALEFEYDPNDPDCPNGDEGRMIAELLVKNLPTAQPAAPRYKAQRAKTE